MERSLKALIREQIQFYKTQHLPADWFVIFIDGYRAKMRTEEGKVQKVLSVAVRIDLGRPSTSWGSGWLGVGSPRSSGSRCCRTSLNRGTHRVLLFGTDDFPGLSEVTRNLFPYAFHHCLGHLERNLNRKLSTPRYREARRLLLRIREAKDGEEGAVPFASLCQLVEQEKPQMAKHLRDRDENYSAFPGVPG